MTGYNGASSFVVTTNYVTPRSPVIQGSYLELPIMQTATKFEFLVVSTHWSQSSCSYRASLTEIEVFADGQNIYDRYDEIWELMAKTTINNWKGMNI